MSQLDTQQEQVLKVVKLTLVQFDLLCKELENAKKGTPSNSLAEIEKMKIQWANYLAEQQKIKEDFNSCQSECQSLAQSDTNKNMKKIRKLYQKLQDDVAHVTEIQKRAQELEQNIAVLEQQSRGDLPSLDDLKKQYTTTFEIIQGFKQSVPDVYNEAERQTGIYFFTLPTH
jgi:chromosome segregation ATPase